MLLLGVASDDELRTVMHRVRILTATEYNRAKGAVGTRRRARGFEVIEVERSRVREATRKILASGGTKPNARLDERPADGPARRPRGTARAPLR